VLVRSRGRDLEATTLITEDAIYNLTGIEHKCSYMGPYIETLHSLIGQIVGDQYCTAQYY
jgi:hypothetical protein